MKLEGCLEQAVEALVGAIKGSDAYGKYLSALAAVKQQPELKQQIDRFRRENYIMQNTGDMAFERIEQFEREYSDFRENPWCRIFWRRNWPCAAQSSRLTLILRKHWILSREQVIQA